MTQQSITAVRSARWPALLAYGGPLLCLLWAYWTTLTELSQRWSYDASYSHGWLVPVFAAVLLWLRRDLMPTELVRPSWLWGGLLLTVGVACRLFGAYFHFVWYDPISLLPCLAGVVLLVGGWSAIRWTWPAILFLGFMIPLPYRYAGMLAEPLQRFATVVSTFLLQAFGLPALAEGNVILLSEVEMGIVEACSGLRMLVVFFALSTAFALIVRRPIWEKLLIVTSAVPIALAANVLRITATGVLHETVSSELANAVFHDFAGWLMMPIGLGMLGAELKVLQLLLLPPADAPAIVPVPPAASAPLPGAAPAAGAAPTRTRRAWQPSRHSKMNNPAGLP